MEEIIKMIGYCTVGAILIGAGWMIFSTAADLLLALTATPIGLIILLVFGLFLLRLVSK